MYFCLGDRPAKVNEIRTKPFFKVIFTERIRKLAAFASKAEQFARLRANFSAVKSLPCILKSVSFATSF
jgi:hypothetical protein